MASSDLTSLAHTAHASGSEGSARARPSLNEWLALVLGLALIARYRWLVDDAFVYFRYVDNLLFLGRGLVYNHGEFVEGYSSPLWTLVMIVLRALRIGYWEMVLGMGLVTYVGFWFLAVRVNRALSPLGARAFSFPLLFLSTNYAVMTWFTSGLEVPFVQLAAVSFAWLIVRPSSRLAQVLVALAPLVRPELVLPFVIVFAWVWWRARRLPWFLGLLAVAIQVLWMSFRIYYYADLFPNTFHLKDGVWVEQGLSYLADAFLPYHIPFIVAGLLGATLLVRRRSLPAFWPERLVMLLCAVPGILYVIKIGGTHLHYMYLAFPFCLVLLSLSGCVERLFEPLSARRAVAGTGSTVLAVAVCAASLSLYPKQEPRNPLWLEPRGSKVAHTISDANLARHHRDLSYRKRRAEVPLETILELRDRFPGQPVPHHETLVHSWCATMYRAPETLTINRHGLTDGVLAHIHCIPSRPGHYPLRPFALDIETVQNEATEVGRGMYRAAVDQGRAPEWIVKNVDQLERIASKIYNRHDFMENVGLALHSEPKIRP
ncbi:MAG: hypothetical protein ACI8QZ_000231 [Chlamydiales bacterium]|jgi:hypothetical protein